MTLGGILMGTWGGLRNRVRTMAVASGMMGVCTIALGLIPWFVPYLAVMGLFGVMIPVFNTPGTVILQERVEDEFRGRGVRSDDHDNDDHDASRHDDFRTGCRRRADRVPARRNGHRTFGDRHPSFGESHARRRRRAARFRRGGAISFLEAARWQNGELTDRMNGAIGRLVKNATKIALSDFSAVPSLVNILKRQGAASELRKKHEAEGLHVPPFMIASIVRACNLRCAGCYDRAKQDAGTDSSCGANADVLQKIAVRSREIDDGSWSRVFGEARDLGVSFILLAGGEPLLKREVVRSCADFPEIIFPVFTNGLLIDESWIDFFSVARNVIPVLSLEGDEAHTDKRRGSGVFSSVSDRLALLKKRKIFYGVSITLTSENYETVLSEPYVGGLVAGGARVIFFVEYVPFDPATDSLVVSELQKSVLPARLKNLREKYTAIMLDFPGDEGAFGGCLASGRGFVHVNASGSLESCPFAPYSDSSIAERPLAEALASPLLGRIRDLQENLGHAGGCTLFENREKVEALL